MAETADQRFAPPVAHVEDVVASGDTPELGGRGMRLLAAIVDGLLLGGLAFVLLLLPPFQPLVRESTETWHFGSQIMGIVLFLLVQSIPLITRGQTIGKMICRLKIVRTDGSKASAWRLIGLRYGAGLLVNVNVTLSMIYSLIDCLLIFRESRQCLHDTIADTKVIKL